MQTTMENKEMEPFISVNKPSLLRQIMDKVDEMDDTSKKMLLLTLTQQELSVKYKKLDDEIAKSQEILDEEKIDQLVTETRNEIYEQKIRS